MSKLTTKVSIPVILAGIFAMTVFIAFDHENINLPFYILIFLLSVFVLFFGFATGQQFSSPVKKLLERAKELSEGNLSTRVYLETKDELSELAKVFNKIAENMEYSKTEQENTEKSVGIKVRAKTQELEETIEALEQKVKNRTVELERLISEYDRFKQNIKNKEKETEDLRKELESLRQKSGKIGRPKKVTKQI